jgi:putative DNA primase/helicase
LIRRETGRSNGAALDWLRERGFIEAARRDPSGAQRDRVAATYPYHDEAGALLFQVVRVSPKSFRQRRPDGRGGWAWKLGDCRRVLYRLPELLAAPADAAVFVCEGEKDADRLAKLGLIATTNAGGAGSWRDDYAATLAGRRCVVLPDVDEPGRAHAAAVLASLRRAGVAAAVLELPGLPVKGDVSD